MVFGTPKKSMRYKNADGIFQTGSVSTPFISLPGTPLMKRLGFGTCVEVSLLERRNKKGPLTPWAVKMAVGKRGRKVNAKVKAEAKILEELNHINIVKFKSLSKKIDGTYVLSMESCELSLFDLIEQRIEDGSGPFLPGDIKKVSLAVVNALDYLHNDKHLLHGDIKSPNIILNRDFSSIKLCDFGNTLKLTSELVAKNNKSLYGTRLWTCKEVIEDEPATDKADIYAFGCVVFEMLSLSMPHLEDFPNQEDYETEEEFQEVYDTAEENLEFQLGQRPNLYQEKFSRSYSQAFQTYWMCTDPMKERRPNAKELKESLEVELVEEYAEDTKEEFKEPKMRLEF